VALAGGPEGEILIRRAARIAARGAADLLAVHVISPTALTGADPGALALQRGLVESLGGSYHQIIGDDVSAALLDFARAEEATQLVLGTSRRSRIATFLTGLGVSARTIRNSGPIDVHMVSHSEAARGEQLPRGRGGLTIKRRAEGAALAALLLPSLTVALTHTRAHVNYASQLLAYLLTVVAVALVGGIWPALAAAIAGTALVNWFFTPPFHTWTVAEANNIVAIVVFVLVAVAVSSVVDLAARRTRLAARTSAESHALYALAGSVLRGAALPALLDRTREAFGMTAVSLLERDGPGWRVVAATGPEPCSTPDQADIAVPAGADVQLGMRGRPLPEEDRRLLTAFAAQAAAALVRQRLAEADAVIKPLEQADRTRTALLTAVSHDLRTPLASAKAAVASLRSSEVKWSEGERRELLETAESGLDRLTRLVENLLDMSRLQAGALSVFPRAVSVEEIAAVALDNVPGGTLVGVDAPVDVPDALADAALLERVVANLVENALRYSPGEAPPRVAISAHGGRVETRVVDHGPGIPAADREHVFAPFQRLGDTDNTTGVGLGLALSRGLAEAMGGTLTAEDTPGGGLTMTVNLPAAAAVRTAPGAREAQMQPEQADRASRQPP
jgi:two-component system sensor histidine kinase KdpD